MASHLHFVEVKDTGKTKVFYVQSSAHQFLGEVKWYAHWRRYCFYPDSRALFDAICLREIVDFIEQQMTNRRAA